jgi:hypothetical protein
MQVDPDRRWRQSGSLRDLGAAHSFDQPHQERLPIRLGQTSHSIQNRERLHFHRVAARQLIGQFGLVLDPAKMISRTVAGYGAEPAPEGGRIAQSVQLRERGKKDLLHEVINIAPRHTSQQNRMHHPDVVGVELSEGIPVARGGRQDCQPGIGTFGRGALRASRHHGPPAAKLTSVADQGRIPKF